MYVNSQKITGKLHYKPYPRLRRADTGRRRHTHNMLLITPELGTTGQVLDGGRWARSTAPRKGRSGEAEKVCRLQLGQGAEPAGAGVLEDLARTTGLALSFTFAGLRF